MTQFPYMPLYVDRLTADTQHLTASEFGSYVLLLCAMWLHGGELPDDSQMLRRICRCSDNRSWPRLFKKLDPFLIHEGGKVTQKRLKETLASTREKSRNAKMAAESKWAKHTSVSTPLRAHVTNGVKPLKNNKQGNADAYAKGMPRALAREPDTDTSPIGAVSGSPLPPTENSQPAARSRGLEGRSRAKPPASANGALPPKLSEWDMPPAPGPRGQTKFLQAEAAFKAGDETALDPLPGAPEKPKKETRQ